MRDQRVDQRPPVPGHVGIEERPEVVAADRHARFDQRDRDVGAMLRQRECAEATGQAAADDDEGGRWH